MTTGPKPRSHCMNGHELTQDNSFQTYRNGTKNGRKCRSCERIWQDGYRGRNPDVMYKSRTEAQLRKYYDIKSLAERDAILADQGNACAICGRTNCSWGSGFQNVWHIDHKHGTCSHRGILCGSCNMLVGVIEKWLSLLGRCFDYLRYWENR